MAMTTRTEQEEEEETTTLLISNRNQNDDESEEETLSLCDLPVNLPIKNNDEFRFQEKEEEEEKEFEFGSTFRVGSDSSEPGPEMSTADELFFKGRILPFRHSVSLDDGLKNNRLLMITRSESAEFRRTGINRSDRDSSKIKIKNRFIDYSQPSPNPQIIRRSSSMTAARVNPKSSSSSSIWDFLRLGLVRTPEIELRTTGNPSKLTVSRNSSCSSTSTSSNSRSRNRRRGFFFGDCKCSVSTEVVVTTDSPVKKKKEEKSAIARSRTFEWLKELSQVDHGRRSLAS